jgi:transposase
VFCLVVTAVAGLVGTVCGMSYSSDLTDEQWALLEPVFNAPGKRGPKDAPDLRRVVDAMLYVSHTGCQWRYLPESSGPWTRVWSQFRRWSRNGTWTRALTVLHAAAREADGRADATPSMVVIDTDLARGASNGGFTFHDRGGPYGRTKGAKREVAGDVTAARTLGRHHDLELRRVGLGRQAAGAPPHPARLARRGRPRPPRTLPPSCEVVREHHHLGDRLASGRLHRDHLRHLSRVRAQRALPLAA